MRHQQARTNAAHRVAEDNHWITAGSTGAGAVVTGDRHAAGPEVPLNLRVYEVAELLDRELAEFAHRHASGPAPTGRKHLAAYAYSIAQQADADARSDYEVLQMASNLRAAMETGDADQAVGKLTCPGCLCWSLISARIRGQWHCVCLNLRCAPTPDAPRSWALADVARHNLVAVS
ncbi:hypothetical protein [Kitasatospora sp. NPDC085464]|uniref:hypothetical protein n=1 Tax=Kitasatospora sp. NPDC085464 TaxID=3364063 RepID=UPI0037C7AB7D